MTDSRSIGPHEPRVIRSGVSKLFFWMGICLMGIGIVMGLAGVIMAAVTSDTGLLGLLIMTPIGLVAGGLMHAAGRRSRVELTADQIHWVPALGSATSVPWAVVHHVEVPLDWRDGRAARLVLRNGQRVEITAIRMSSRSGGGVWPDAGYRTAGEQIIEAHKAWLWAQQPRP